MIKTLKIFIFTIVAVFSINILPAAAEVCFNPQIDIPGMSAVFSETCKDASGNFSGYKIDGNSIGKFIVVVFKYSIGVIGILAAIALMIGGVIWLTAGGNSQRVSTAQDWIKGSLTGLALAVCSFLILSTINPDLTVFKGLQINQVESVGCCAKPKNVDVCSMVLKSECASGWGGANQVCDRSGKCIEKSLTQCYGKTNGTVCKKDGDSSKPGICVNETCYENKGCCGFMLADGDRAFCEDYNQPAGENYCLRAIQTSLGSPLKTGTKNQWYGGNYKCTETAGSRLIGGLIKNCILTK